MAEWVSWEEAIEVVARDFSLERAEELLRAAILRGGVIEVRVTDHGYVSGSLGGRYVPDNPDYPYAAGAARPYYMIEDVNLSSLKRWLTSLKSDSASAKMKHRGGREPKYDYEGGLIELARAAYVGDLKLNSSQAVFQWLQDWMTKTYPNGGPDPRSVRARSNKFFDALEPPENRKT